jgi:hypothetical protein
VDIVKIAFLCVFLSACSPIPQSNSDLPNYSDMGAAEDAGKVTAPAVPEGM